MTVMKSNKTVVSSNCAPVKGFLICSLTLMLHRERCIDCPYSTRTEVF